MNARKFLIHFATVFSIVLLVSVIVTFVYNLIIHGAGVIDWETSFRLSIILGIALPWVRMREAKQGGK
jgi:hypothetical protein